MRIDFNLSNTEGGKFRTACEAVLRNVAAGTKAATEEAAIDIMSDSLDQVPIDTGTLASSAYIGIGRRDDVSGYSYGAVLGYGDTAGLAAATGVGQGRRYRAVTAETPSSSSFPRLPGEQPGYGQGRLKGGSTLVTAHELFGGPMQWLKAPSNPINPKHGGPASMYAGRVHEDLEMPHRNGGKAKFLEDPIRNWASGRFTRTAMTYWGLAITRSNARVPVYKWDSGSRRMMLMSKFKNITVANYSHVKRSSGVQRGGKYVYKGEDR